MRDSGAGDVFEEAVLALLDETVIEAAGSATYPWGGSRPDAAQLNFGGVIAGNVRHTVNVGSYPLGRSRLGAHDMAGNVWEWTADWYDERSYVNSSRDIGRNISSAIRSVELGKQSNSFPTISLADIVPGDPGGANNGEARVIRGGSWIDGELGVRSSSRGAVSPTTRATGIGFRCAR